MSNNLILGLYVYLEECIYIHHTHIDINIHKFTHILKYVVKNIYIHTHKYKYNYINIHNYNNLMYIYYIKKRVHFYIFKHLTSSN